MAINFLRNGTLALALTASAGIALAAVTVYPDGTGFVGKGDVQLVYGWNNKALQDNVELVQFRVKSVTEVTWECTNSNNQKVQERSRETTIEGLLSSIAREKNQITGFYLNGFNGDPNTETEGPAVNSCPNTAGSWSLTTPASDPVPVGGGGVQVSTNGTHWFQL